MKKGQFDHAILLLQGGGALGAYQAGAYEGLVEAGITPDWVVGISIGAINATLIAGNPPGRRVQRLREFWDRVSSRVPMIPPPWLDPIRPTLNQLSSSMAAMHGAPGFFSPRVPPPPIYSPNGNPPEAMSFYYTDPLKSTLEELVDFDLINSQKVRLSLGVVNVGTGNSLYFDNQQTRIGPDHVRASGALPPGFPPVVIEGEHYWDGGIVCNSPMLYVLDDLPRMSALVVQVDIFMAQGELPRDIDEVLSREKDIRLASKTLFNIAHIRELLETRGALKELLAKLPASLKDDPVVRKLAPLCDVGELTITRLINRGLSHAGHTKGYDFSRATVNELWAKGLDDVRRSAVNIKSMRPRELGPGIRVYDLPYEVTSASMPEPDAEQEPVQQRRSSRFDRPRVSHLRAIRPGRARHNGERNRHRAKAAKRFRSAEG
jgi:NTE family protein